MNKFVAKPLPHFVSHKNATVISCGRRNLTLVKLPNSSDVYAADHVHEVDMTREYVTNAKERSVWCRLAGVQVKDLNQARTNAKKQAAERSKKRDIDWVRSRAARAGFRLVKVRAPK